MIDQRQPVLDDVDGSLGVTALDVFEAVVGQAYRSHQSVVDELCQRTPRLVERHPGRIRVVKEVDVDVVAAEASEAGLTPGSDLVASEPTAVRCRRELAGDQHLVTDLAQKPAR